MNMSAIETGRCPVCGRFLSKTQTQCGICGARIDAATGEAHAVHLSDAEVDNMLKKQVGRNTASLVVAIASGIVLLAGGALGQVAVSLVAALPLLVALAYHFLLGKNLVRGIVGSNVVRGCLNEVFENLVYEMDAHIDKGRLLETGLIPDAGAASGDDHIKGCYRGLNVELSDVVLSKVTMIKDGNGRRRESYQTVFRGPWIVCDFGKATAIRLCLRERGVLPSLQGEEIQTENPVFNRRFQVEATSAHDAFYILTPPLMERILVADDRANGQTFLCFTGGSVHIALNTGRNLFELPANYGDVTALRRQIREEIQYITDILDILMQNEHLKTD